MLLPHLGGVVVDRIRPDSDRVVIEARGIGDATECPGCGVASSRVHGRYQRTVADVASAGRAVVVQLSVRRFVCDVSSCVRVTFAEQFPGLTTPYARYSPPLRAMLVSIAVALAGRPGSRLARSLGITVGRDTLLAMIRGLPEPAVGAVTVLGVDDFAVRRGRVYGSILLDMATHRPVDVLPDREAATLASWLQAHPGVEIICRDRAGAYAEGARTGAPNAIQVADRWHLWSNLCDAVHRAVVAHRGCLPEPPAAGSGELAPSAHDLKPDSLAVVRLRERYTAIREHVGLGVPRTVIASMLNLDPATVARYADAETVDELLATRHKPSPLDPFKNYLDGRWNAGCTDAVRLTGELRLQGYRGSSRSVRRYLEPLRASGTPAAHAPTPPKPRQVTSWITCHPDNLPEAKKSQLKSLLNRCPELAVLADLTTGFAKLIRHRHGDQLPAWLAAADATDLPSLHTFAAGLRRDLDAVTNGLTLTWNSGAVEGTVCKIKLVKRTMFGRANFDLLRLRILNQ